MALLWSWNDKHFLTSYYTSTCPASGITSSMRLIQCCFYFISLIFFIWTTSLIIYFTSSYFIHLFSISTNESFLIYLLSLDIFIVYLIDKFNLFTLASNLSILSLYCLSFISTKFFLFYVIDLDKISFVLTFYLLLVCDEANNYGRP